MAGISARTRHPRSGRRRPAASSSSAGRSMPRSARSASTGTRAAPATSAPPEAPVRRRPTSARAGRAIQQAGRFRARLRDGARDGRERRAKEAVAAGHAVSARDHAFVAALLWGSAEWTFFLGRAAARRAHEDNALKLASYDHWIEQAPHPVRRLRIPYGNTSLSADPAPARRSGAIGWLPRRCCMSAAWTASRSMRSPWSAIATCSGARSAASSTAPDRARLSSTAPGSHASTWSRPASRRSKRWPPSRRSTATGWA